MAAAISGSPAKDEAAGAFSLLLWALGRGLLPSSSRFRSAPAPACSVGGWLCSLLKCVLAWTCGHTLCQCLWVTFLAAEGQGWCPTRGTLS